MKIMSELSLVLIGITFVAPLYYIGLFFLFIFLRDKYEDSRKNKNNISDVVMEKMIETQEKIAEFQEVTESIEDKVKEEVNSEINQSRITIEEATARVNAFVAENEARKFRMSISIENLEKNLNKMLANVIDNYMMNTYYNNPSHAKADGTFILPRIDHDTKVADLERIYLRFRSIVNHDFIKDLSVLYNIDTPEGESFIVSRYIAPMYNNEVEAMKELYRVSTEENRIIEEEDAKKLEKEFSKLSNPEYSHRERLIEQIKNLDFKNPKKKKEA